MLKTGVAISLSTVTTIGVGAVLVLPAASVATTERLFWPSTPKSDLSTDTSKLPLATAAASTVAVPTTLPPS